MAHPERSTKARLGLKAHDAALSACDARERAAFYEAFDHAAKERRRVRSRNRKMHRAGGVTAAELIMTREVDAL